MAEKHTWWQLCGFRNTGKKYCYLISIIHCILCLNQYLNMESWQTTQLDQFKDETSSFKVIKLILAGDYINKTEILSILKSRFAKMYQLFQ